MKNKNKKTKLYNPYSVRTTFHKSNQSKKKTSKNVSRPNKKLPEFQKELMESFVRTVDKVFQSLDKFSRGFITEANIHNWLPQPVFYFLGSVFQKIKTSLKCVTLDQFRQQCKKILPISTEEDIKEFINSMENVEVLKLSVENEKPQLKESKVQGRLNLQHDGLASFHQNFINEKSENIPLKEEVGMKKSKKNPTPLTQINNFYKDNESLTDLYKKKEDRQVLLECDEQNKPDKLTHSPQFRKGSKENLGSDRIDKLSMRLQNFINQNSKRLEISKNIRFEP